MRRSKSVIQRYELSGSFSSTQIVQVPVGLNVFRISVQARMVNNALFPNETPIEPMYGMIATQPFGNANYNGTINSWKLFIKPVPRPNSNTCYLMPSDTLVFDRRGMDCAANDVFYIAMKDDNNHPTFITMEIVFIFEGYSEN